MRSPTRSLFWALIALAPGAALAPPAAMADVVAVPALRDATLFADPEGDVASGSGPHFFSGRNGQGIVRRGVIAFDLSAIPAGATITGATLRLNLSAGDEDDRTTTVHRLLADWGEGASASAGGQGAPAAPGDATWLHTFYPDALWTTPGGDFDAAIRASAAVSLPGVYTWSTPDLAADVQAWLDDPASNFGWLLRGDEVVNGSARRFDSLQNADESVRPALIVEYTPVPGPGAGALLLLGVAGVVRRRR